MSSTLSDKVKTAIRKCAEIGMCLGCPYENDEKCQASLRKDALTVIEELEKRADAKQR